MVSHIVAKPRHNREWLTAWKLRFTTSFSTRSHRRVHALWLKCAGGGTAIIAFILIITMAQTTLTDLMGIVS